MAVYRAEDAPKELKFKKNLRIGEIVLIAAFGYHIHITKEGSDISKYKDDKNIFFVIND